MLLIHRVALVPLCLWVWGLTFFLLCGALQQTGAEAASTPSWDAEQGPWRYSPEERQAGMGAGSQGDEPCRWSSSESASETPGQVSGHDPKTRVGSQSLRRCLGMGLRGWVRAVGQTGRGQTVPGVWVTFSKALGKRVAGDFQLGDLQRKK